MELKRYGGVEETVLGSGILVEEEGGTGKEEPLSRSHEFQWHPQRS